MSMLNRIKVTWDFHSEDLEDGWQMAFNRSFSCRAKGKCVVQLVSEAYLEQSRNLSTLATSITRPYPFLIVRGIQFASESLFSQ